jgi:hypothetical protein
MLCYLSTHTGAFSPDEITVLVSAFEQACGSVLVQLDERGEEAAREIIAQRIIETASKGERDKDRLAKDALDHLAAALLNAPRRPSFEDAPLQPNKLTR